MTKILPISRFTVNGHSMFPTLKPGQDILSFNWAYLGIKPKVGDIVIVKSEKFKVQSEVVKRVIKVEDNQVWVEGDNKAESTDSRDFGPVKMEQVIGKVIYQTERHSGPVPESQMIEILKQVQDDDLIPCPSCGGPVIGVYGRKDAICKNCGFKLSCCGEP